MTTSCHQRDKAEMHRISANNPVRRRLFADSLDDQARFDNFANALEESITTEKLEKMRKWNFDFEKETPLEGVYEWYPCNGPDWIGVKGSKFTSVDKEVDDIDLLKLKYENELTPRGDKVGREGRVPLMRKRRKEIEDLLGDRAVKRKISF